MYITVYVYKLVQHIIKQTVSFETFLVLSKDDALNKFHDKVRTDNETMMWNHVASNFQI